MRQLELMAAKYGALAVPSHITLEIEESLKLARECGSVAVIGQALYNIATLKSDLGQRQSSATHVHDALDLFRRLGMKREQAEALLARLGDAAGAA
jgi:hypothetical protein